MYRNRLAQRVGAVVSLAVGIGVLFGMLYIFRYFGLFKLLDAIYLNLKEPAGRFWFFVVVMLLSWFATFAGAFSQKVDGARLSNVVALALHTSILFLFATDFIGVNPPKSFLIYLSFHVFFGVIIALDVLHGLISPLAQHLRQLSIHAEGLSATLKAMQADLSSLEIRGGQSFEIRKARILQKLKRLFPDFADEMTEAYAEVVSRSYYNYRAYRKQNNQIEYNQYSMEDRAAPPREETSNEKFVRHLAVSMLKGNCIEAAPDRLRRHLQTLSDPDLRHAFGHVYDSHDL